MNGVACQSVFQSQRGYRVLFFFKFHFIRYQIHEHTINPLNFARNDLQISLENAKGLEVQGKIYSLDNVKVLPNLCSKNPNYSGRETEVLTHSGEGTSGGSTTSIFFTPIPKGIINL